MDKLLFGAAYYDEYMPYERLAEDIKMMKAASMNVVRIAESTWGTLEPEEGKFDFTHVDRVLEAMQKNDISVIIGTPTYALPTWLVRSYPDILAETRQGRGRYGTRQNMDITHPAYCQHVQVVVEKLVEHVYAYPCVIGYQIDNETKHYGTASERVQIGFVKYLKEKFAGDLKRLNEAFGLNYWSNRINTWEDFPDVRGTINASLGAEFEKYQRMLVTKFLKSQADIVTRFKREDQFITNNMDFDWRGYSYGVQRDVSHPAVSEVLTINGCDIYHPTQDQLTGEEIAFCGDLMRCLKNENYLVLETQAQGHLNWLPYRGQLRLQAFSHLASGADSVLYWHWHSIHNGCESYWKGVLSHDFGENAVYQEAKEIGKEFTELSKHLVHLKKCNKAAILVNNESLTSLDWFRPGHGAMYGEGPVYNDIVRAIYRQLYRMNIECDVLFTETVTDLENYSAVFLPALYSCEERIPDMLAAYVKGGGHLIVTCRSVIADEHVKIYPDQLPHRMTECLGMYHNLCTVPEGVSLSQETYPVGTENSGVHTIMEMLVPTTAKVLASYVHPEWNKYAAITRNSFGDGSATYIGCLVDERYLYECIKECVVQSGLIPEQDGIGFPIIRKSGINQAGKQIAYYLNYSGESNDFTYSEKSGTELFSGDSIDTGKVITIPPWGLMIIESE